MVWTCIDGRLFEVHDVLAAAGRGTDEDRTPEDRRTVEHHLPGDHAAEREGDWRHCSQGRLKQVGWNLLANAIKFTTTGGRVNIAVTAADRCVRIEVRDTGQGIEPEFLPHVLDRFRQAVLPTGAHGGLALGLAIVRHLVELHGGQSERR